MVSEPLYFHLSQGETDIDEGHRPGRRWKNTAVFIWLTFSLNSKPLTYTCYSPYKKGWFIFLKRYLFLERGKEREKEREREKHWCVRYIDQLPLAPSQLGTWPATQACALTGHRTGDLSFPRPALNPLSHTSQGKKRVSSKWNWRWSVRVQTQHLLRSMTIWVKIQLTLRLRTDSNQKGGVGGSWGEKGEGLSSNKYKGHTDKVKGR